MMLPFIVFIASLMIHEISKFLTVANKVRAVHFLVNSDGLDQHTMLIKSPDVYLRHVNI